VGSVRAYINRNNFFSINEPLGWTTNESTGGNVVVTFTEPTSNNDSIALIQIMVQTTSSNMTLEDLVTVAKNQEFLTFSSFSIIREAYRVVNGVDAYEIVATITTQGYNLRIDQVMMIKNLRIYIVTYAAVPDRYQHFYSDFDNSMETFTILDPIPWYFAYVFFGAIITVLAIIAIGLYFYKKRATPPFSFAQYFFN
jgi:hypothetical protein